MRIFTAEGILHKLSANFRIFFRVLFWLIFSPQDVPKIRGGFKMAGRLEGGGGIMP